jgi:DNA repair exonuclease SbcCD nuclease subunit
MKKFIYDIVYTSDFQLCLSNRIDDFICSLNQISEKANQGKRLIIGGDIYQKRKPHPKEQNIFRDFIKSVKVRKDIILGNHDWNLDATTIDEFSKFDIEDTHIHTAPYVLEYNNRKFYIDHTIVENARLGNNGFILDKSKTKSLKEILSYNCDMYLLGDVHRPQVINKIPPILYSGSIEREDFGERKDKKYIILINSETLEYKYHELKIRPMYQIDVDLEEGKEVYKVNGKERALSEIESGAIIRVIVSGKEEQVKTYSNEKILKSLTLPLSLQVAYDIKRENRKRNSEISEGKSPEECFLEYAKYKNFSEIEAQKGIAIIKDESD